MEGKASVKKKTKKKKQREKKVKESPLRRIVRLCIITGLLAAILAFLLLFKISNIIVTGNDRYTDAQIKSFVLEEGDFYNTVFFCLLNKTIETDSIPLLESIEVSYVNRNTISLKANEKLTIGMFQVGEKVCCIDQDGIVIEILDYEGSEELNLPLNHKLCSKVTVGEVIEIEDASVLNTLHAMMSSFVKYDIMPSDIYIEEEESSIYKDEIIKTYTLYFGDIRVLAGEDEYLEEKMRRAAAILDTLSEEGITKGTLHLEVYDEDTENIIFDKDEV